MWNNAIPLASALTSSMPIVIGSGFLVALVLGPIIIPMLARLKFGQQVRQEGLQSHLAKQGTPTMGGIIIMLALLVGFMLFVKFDTKQQMIETFTRFN